MARAVYSFTDKLGLSSKTRRNLPAYRTNRISIINYIFAMCLRQVRFDKFNIFRIDRLVIACGGQGTLRK